MFFTPLRSSLQNLIPVVKTPSVTIFRVGNSITHNYMRL